MPNWHLMPKTTPCTVMRQLYRHQFSLSPEGETMKKVVLLLCLILNGLSATIGGEVSRRKRYLIYPTGGSKVQFIVGTGVPVPVENQSVTMGWVVKSAYLVAENASAITDQYITFQKRSRGRRATRYDFYRSFEHAAENFGGGGKECMLRAICESSRVPFRASNLAGQILHIFLTPSSTDEQPVTRTDMDYHSAEKLGKEDGVDCAALYPGCFFSIVDILTVIM